MVNIGIITSILLLSVTVLTVGLIKKKFPAKKIFKIIIIILLLISCIIFGAYEYFNRSSSFRFAKTTALSQENIDGIKIYESIDSKKFVQKYGTNLKRIDNDLFDYYKVSALRKSALSSENIHEIITLNIELKFFKFFNLKNLSKEL